MSVSLKCPNGCAAVGEAGHEDNYKEKYFHTNDEGKPVCVNCGAGNSHGDAGIILFISVAALIAVVSIIAAIFSDK